MAASTLGTGIQVQQVFPGKIANFAITGMCRYRLLRYGWQRHTGQFVAENEVGEIGEEMYCFGKRDIGDEGQRQRDVKPP